MYLRRLFCRAKKGFFHSHALLSIKLRKTHAVLFAMQTPLDFCNIGVVAFGRGRTRGMARFLFRTIAQIGEGRSRPLDDYPNRRLPRSAASL